MKKGIYITLGLTVLAFLGFNVMFMAVIKEEILMMIYPSLIFWKGYMVLLWVSFGSVFWFFSQNADKID
jgi:hypothetical protein